MRLPLLFLLLSLLSSSLRAAEPFRLPSEGILILPPSLGLTLLNQCSRKAPEGANEFWRPSPREIAELEGLLVSYLEARRQAGERVPPLAPVYHRQYVGYIQNGIRYIYGNYYPTGPGLSGRQEQRPVVICDGGASFWGIVYKVQAKQFEAPQFNGKV
jgi:hypothetical protein